MPASEKIYILLCTLFAVLATTGNLIYQKFVQLKIFSFYTFELSVGAIFYPLTFLITNLITEFYGKQKAKFCIKLAVLMNITVALIISCMNHLSATSWSRVDDNIFNTVFGMYNISFIGSIIANYIAQIVDISLYLFIRRITNNQYLFLRSLSSAVALLIDTIIVVIFITTFKAIPLEQMLPLITNSYLFKLLFTFLNIPIFYIAVYCIKLAVKDYTINASIRNISQ